MTSLSIVLATHIYHGLSEPSVIDVSMELHTGEVTALVGPNGAGKSTLLKVALEGAQRGEVRWFGRPFAEWSRRQLARQVAYLAQSPGALPGQSVHEVLASGRSAYWGWFGVESPADREAVDAVAEELHLTEWLRRPIDTLSGGQRQRVFLGRCLTQLHGQPNAAVLLDEPDTFLDLARAAELGALVRSLAKRRGLGVLVASHDLNLAARVADRIVLMSRGRVVAAGTPREVLKPELLSEVYETSVRCVEVEGTVVVVPEIEHSTSSLRL